MTDQASGTSGDSFSWTTEWPDDRGPWLVTLDLQIVRGRLEATGVTISPRARLKRQSPIPLTSTDLRLPLGRLVQQAGSEHVAVQKAVAQMASWPPESPPGPDVEAEDIPTPGGRHRRRPEYDQEHYVNVARTYQRGLIATGRPTLAVKQELQISYSLAAKFVGEARHRGLLPSTTRGRISQPDDTPRPFE